MRTAKNYAEALFSLSEELKKTDAVLKDVEICSKALAENPKYVSLTDTPAISVPEKIALIDAAFSSVDEMIKNLLKILCESHSVHMFTDIVREYISVYNESRGICPAEVVSAVPLSDEQKKAMKARIEKMTGKTVVLKNSVDKDILGGAIVRFMGRQYDGSLGARLSSIEKSLKETVI